MTSKDEQKTFSRASLSPGFMANRQQLDWMSIPGAASYVNSMVSGRPLSDRGHWAKYAAEKWVIPLSRRLGRELRMVSFACGKAHIESGLVCNHGWPISEFLGLEYDAALRADGEQRLSEIANLNGRIEFFDFNATENSPREKFDIVFAHHSIHHATDVEGLLHYANELMDDHSLFIGSDYFGPTRFQVTYETRQIIDRLDRLLPDELRVNLKNDKIGPVQYPTLKHMRYDWSESARSADLRVLLFSNFPVLEMKPMGGTILRWLLQFRAGNFNRNNPLHVSIAALLIDIERSMIESKQIQSDDLFFVLGRSDRLVNDWKTEVQC